MVKVKDRVTDRLMVMVRFVSLVQWRGKGFGFVFVLLLFLLLFF